MKLLAPVFCMLLLVTPTSVLAQKSISDSTINLGLFEASVAFHVPGGDMKEHFGSSANISGAFNYKTFKNWTFGAQVSFLTGTNVKNENDLVSNIISSTGPISSDGRHATVDMNERGMNISLQIGKVLPLFGPNKNSGLWLQFGAGYFYHKIKIEDINSETPIFINEEILKGYDNLSAGLSLSQGIGYLHLSSKKLFNYYIGLEFIQGFTENQRGYSYRDMAPVEGRNFDSLMGIKIAWFIPTYKRSADKYHIY